MYMYLAKIATCTCGIIYTFHMKLLFTCPCMLTVLPVMYGLCKHVCCTLAIAMSSRACRAGKNASGL